MGDVASHYAPCGSYPDAPAPRASRNARAALPGPRRAGRRRGRGGSAGSVRARQGPCVMPTIRSALQRPKDPPRPRRRPSPPASTHTTAAHEPSASPYLGLQLRGGARRIQIQHDLDARRPSPGAPLGCERSLLEGCPSAQRHPASPPDGLAGPAAAWRHWLPRASARGRRRKRTPLRHRSHGSSSCISPSPLHPPGRSRTPRVAGAPRAGDRAAGSRGHARRGTL